MYKSITGFFSKSKLVVFILLIALAGCSPRLYPTGSNANLYNVKNLPSDSATLAFYKPYKASIDSQMNAAIGVAAVTIQRGRPEGLLNNFMADVMYETAKENKLEFDFAHTNYEGLRNPIAAGPIKTYKVYELMPFENFFVTVKLKGSDVLDLFNYMAAVGGDPISGATYFIEDKKARDIKINGIPFDVTKEYTVLTNDYLANGGDNAAMYTRAIEKKTSTIKLRDALLAYIKQQQAAGKAIHPKLDQRVQTFNSAK